MGHWTEGGQYVSADEEQIEEQIEITAEITDRAVEAAREEMDWLDALAEFFASLVEGIFGGREG